MDDTKKTKQTDEAPDEVKTEPKNQDETPQVEKQLTEEQIKEDTQMAEVSDDLRESEEINEKPDELTKEQIEEDTEMVSTEGVSTQEVEPTKPAKELTQEQIEEDTEMVSTEGVATQEEAPVKKADEVATEGQAGKPDKLTEDDIKKDQEMAPVEDPDEKLDQAKKVLSKSDPNDPAKWFIVHTYSGHEGKVSKSIKQRVQSLGFENRIFDIIVPTRNTIKVSQGKKENVKEKIFPGYVLVKMILDDESWLLIRTTQGVTAFIGAGNKPTPISDKEVEAIQKFMNEEEPLYKTSFTIGEAVKIVDGPFSDFLGTIDNIDEEKGKLKVLVSIFGRETPVELDFLQVNKL